MSADVIAPGDGLTAEVASEIRARMGRDNVSRAELARRLKVEDSWVGKRLNGRTEIGLSDLQRIARALGVPVIDLLPRSERDAVTLKFPQPSPDFYDPLPAAPRHVASRSPMASTYPTGHRPSNRPNGPRRPVLSRPPMAR